MKHKSNPPLVIAHRGGAKEFCSVENTTSVFQNAIKEKIAMIEFDVRRTKDNQLVVFHDEQIEQVKLSSLSYQELNEKAKQFNYEVPLLETVLALCAKKTMLDIELKEDGYVEEVISLLNCYCSYEHFIITSFLDSVIKHVKELDSSIKTGLLIGIKDATIKQRLRELFPFRRLKKINADFVVPNYQLVTPWLVALCRYFHYNIYVWTVNDDIIYTKLMKKKVTAIITDYPKRYTSSYHLIKE